MNPLRSITVAFRHRRAAERPLARTLRRLAMAAVSIAIGVSTLAGEQADGASAPAAAPTAVPAARHAEKLAVITIHGPIDRWTAYSVQRRVKAAERIGADGIVFDINTPGGELGATLELCNLIKQSPIPNTIAWVNQDAYSAGTFIALACREIIASPYATMGDAAPIAISPFGGVAIPETERQKMLAPLLAEIIDSARRRGYDEKLVQGFIMLNVELWLVEHTQTGQRLFIGAQEHRTIFGEAPERTSARHSSTPGGQADADSTTRPGAPPAPGDFQPAAPGMDREAVKEIEDALADKSAISTRPTLTSADRGQWTLIEYTTDGSTLLTFKTEDLLRYNLAAEVVRDDAELRAFVGAATLTRLDTTWSEALARFFSYLPVQGLLIVIFLLGLFVEMSSPGVGVAGGVALLALMGLLAPQFIAGAAAWWGVVALLVGLSLIAVELFVVPGFGVFGVAGIAALFAGLLGIVIGPGGVFPQNASERLDLIYGVSTVLLALGTTMVGMYLISKHYRALPLLNRLVLTDMPASDEDDDPGAGLLGAMGDEPGVVRVGDIGVAITPLRPSGAAEFGDTLVDVVSESDFLDQGARVRVIQAGGMRVVVEPVDDADTGLFADVGPEGGGDGGGDRA